MRRGKPLIGEREGRTRQKEKEERGENMKDALKSHRESYFIFTPNYI